MIHKWPWVRACPSALPVAGMVEGSRVAGEEKVFVAEGLDPSDIHDQLIYGMCVFIHLKQQHLFCARLAWCDQIIFLQCGGGGGDAGHEEGEEQGGGQLVAHGWRVGRTTHT